VKIVFTSPPQGGQSFENLCQQAKISCQQVPHAREFSLYPGANLYLDAGFDGFFSEGAIPLLFHAPAKTFNVLPGAPQVSARFCAWPGFFERTIWEIALRDIGYSPIFEKVLNQTGISLQVTHDIPGWIAPRILCTIINEAVYTLADSIASAQDIDTAMKLGTNYPQGPLEWAKKIGAEEIATVLEAMAAENARYQPHPKVKAILNTL
jgi:3-hydroxybutyryl-CoA dehydrogenase